MSNQVPSVGRVVHFVNGTQHIPAIITQVNYAVDLPEAGTGWFGQALTVFPPMEAPFTTVAAYDPDGASATWHWPEFVPPKS